MKLVDPSGVWMERTGTHQKRIILNGPQMLVAICCSAGGKGLTLFRTTFFCGSK